MLFGKNVTLRPLKMDDMEKSLLWRNNAKLIELTQGIRYPKTQEMEKAWYVEVLNNKSNRNLYFAIDEKESSEFIGITQLTSIDYISRICDFGIFIGEEIQRGKGYGTETMQLLLEYAFNSLNIRKISLRVIAYNKADHLYHDLGFRKEGKLLKHVFFNNEFHDVSIMALFKDDYIKTP